MEVVEEFSSILRGQFLDELFHDATRFRDTSVPVPSMARDLRRGEFPMSDLEWIERYEIRSNRCCGLEGWGIVVIDSKGFLGIVSDHGDYAYHWSSFGEDFKKFLEGLDWHYLHGKLTMGRRDVYDGDATEKAIKEHILSHRRTRQWTAERAREEWALLGEHEVDHDRSDGFSCWYRETTIDDAGEFHHTRPEPQCQAFCQKIWPRFIEAMKAGLCVAVKPPSLPPLGTPGAEQEV